MIDTYLYFILGVILGQITFSTILLILELNIKSIIKINNKNILILYIFFK